MTPIKTRVDENFWTERKKRAAPLLSKVLARQWRSPRCRCRARYRRQRAGHPSNAAAVGERRRGRDVGRPGSGPISIY